MHVVCDRGFLIHLNHLAWLSENMNTELEFLFCPGWGICYRGWRSALTVQGFFCCTGYSGTISKLFLLLVVLFSSSLPFDPLFFKIIVSSYSRVCHHCSVLFLWISLLFNSIRIHVCLLLFLSVFFSPSIATCYSILFLFSLTINHYI